MRADKNGAVRGAQPDSLQHQQDDVVEEDQHLLAEVLGTRSAGQVPRHAAPPFWQAASHVVGTLSGREQTSLGVRAGP